jgi:ferric-dicitrate binding protein FerR (iron transport regulator)
LNGFVFCIKKGRIRALVHEGGKRKVILTAGEAYFEVIKDKKHPFNV